MRHIGVIDIESGGHNVKKDALCEIALIAMDENLKMKSLTEYIIAPYPMAEAEQEKPGELVRYKEESMKVNGIKKSEIKAGTKSQAVADSVFLTLSSYKITDIIGHNVSYDIRHTKEFLSRHGFKADMKPICTLKMCKDHFKRHGMDSESFSLKTMLAHFEIVNTNPHRAMGDAKATLELYKILLADLSKEEEE